MARTRTRDERLMGAAVLKESFRLRGEADSLMFKALYPGVLQDLDVTDADVEAYAAAHRDEVLKRALAATVKSTPDA